MKTPTETEVQRARFQYSQARSRSRNARGPMAAQSADRSMKAAAEVMQAAGFTMARNGQWVKVAK